MTDVVHTAEGARKGLDLGPPNAGTTNIGLHDATISPDCTRLQSQTDTWLRVYNFRYILGSFPSHALHAHSILSAFITLSIPTVDATRLPSPARRHYYCIMMPSVNFFKKTRTANSVRRNRYCLAARSTIDAERAETVENKLNRGGHLVSLKCIPFPPTLIAPASSNTSNPSRSDEK